MGEARAIMIALMSHKDLGLLLQPPEAGRVDDPVTIPLEWRARGRFRFLVKPPARLLPARYVHGGLFWKLRLSYLGGHE